MPAQPQTRVPPSPDLLDDALLREIARRGTVRSYPANAVLVTEGDVSDALYILLSGRVKVYGSGVDGREIVYSIPVAGEYFGELTLDGGPRSASVMTLEPTSCAVVTGAETRTFLASHPDFALHLVHKLIRCVRASTEHVKSLALEDVYGRVARLLRTLAEEAPAPASEPQRALPERLTQQDIAERVGSSREMVSRIFKSLIEGGYIERRQGRIVLLRKLPQRW
ncbi:MAG: Crp/Fnr family transcriptional regulator [Rubrivivax sp.]